MCSKEAFSISASRDCRLAVKGKPSVGTKTAVEAGLHRGPRQRWPAQTPNRAAGERQTQKRAAKKKLAGRRFLCDGSFVRRGREVRKFHLQRQVPKATYES